MIKKQVKLVFDDDDDHHHHNHHHDQEADVDDDDDDKYDEYDDDYDNDDDDDDYSYCRLSVSPSGTASSATPPPLQAAWRQFPVAPWASQQVRHPVWSTLIGPDPLRYCALIGWDRDVATP